MSAQHTPGRVKFREDGDANHWSMLTEDGRWWLALLANGEQTSAQQVANFRRLAACWNACTGIPTDMLEAMPDGPAALLPMYAQLEAQRDELLQALKGLEEAYCRAGSSLARDERTEDRKRLMYARAVIAKATA